MADAELDELEKQRGEIIQNLEILNAQVKKQNSILHTFIVGIVYGIGFLIGSAILATIVLGILGPIVVQIPGVRQAFEMGLFFLRK
jgi:hypothetical protein